MHNSPAVTVLMSCYNDAPYLSRSVDSILNQTFQDFEFIILDDGSQDSTVDILKSYSDPRISLYIDPPEARHNLGLGARLSQGLALSSAKIVARMDGDDVCHPDRLLKQFGYLKENKDVSMVSSAAILVDEMDRRIGLVDHDLAGNDSFDYLLSHTPPYVHPSVMFRKEAIISVGGYDPELRMCQDYDLWLKLAAAGRKMDILHEPLIKLRRHTKSISASGTANLQMNVVVAARAELRSKNVNVPLQYIVEQCAAVREVGHYARTIEGRRSIRAAFLSLSKGHFAQASRSLFRALTSLRYILVPVRLAKARRSLFERCLEQFSQHPKHEHKDSF